MKTHALLILCFLLEIRCKRNDSETISTLFRSHFRQVGGRLFVPLLTQELDAHAVLADLQAAHMRSSYETPLYSRFHPRLASTCCNFANDPQSRPPCGRNTSHPLKLSSFLLPKVHELNIILLHADVLLMSNADDPL